MSDYRVILRICWGDFKGTRFCDLTDAQLKFVIHRAKKARDCNAAFDEYTYRRKLGLLGENP